VVGVASEKDLISLQATGEGEALLEFLDAHKICGKQLYSGISDGRARGLSMLLSRENLHDEEQFRRQLTERFGKTVTLQDSLGAVSVIGAGINTSYRNVLAGSRALAAHKVLGMSTSSFRITWLVPVQDVDDCVRRLHQTFLEDSAPLVP
jgi:aspartate kinase